jgi:hypothetical protein
MMSRLTTTLVVLLAACCVCRLRGADGRSLEQIDWGRVREGVKTGGASEVIPATVSVLAPRRQPSVTTFDDP